MSKLEQQEGRGTACIKKGPSGEETGWSRTKRSRGKDESLERQPKENRWEEGCDSWKVVGALSGSQNAVLGISFPTQGVPAQPKNVLFPILGAQFWLKMSYFQPSARGQNFDQICLIYNPGGTISTKNVLLPTPVVWFWLNSS